MAGSKGGRGRRNREEHYRQAALAHPLRRAILRLLLDGSDAGAVGIAVELAAAPGHVAHHLRVLHRRGALLGVAKDPPAPPHFRLAPQAPWVRKMLAELDERDREDDQGGRD
jgi:DNA-binding transcriptional ArsR family regulator